MIAERLKDDFNSSSDLKHKLINNINVIYLESICSSNKINDYILKNITMNKKCLILRDNISGPNVIYVSDYNLIKEYLLNGFALIYDKKDMVVCEVKGDLYRSVNPPTAEASVNGPKDSFNESILMNLGLIKRRIKSDKLINEDFMLGTRTLTKVSMLYCDDIVKKDLLSEVRDRLNKTTIDGIVDIEVLIQYMSDDSSSSPMPTILKTERPDRVSQALLEGKVVLIADNSPYALILPAFFSDFVNPQGDRYVRAINGVPFPSAFEALFMIFLCTTLRESDIRFPSSYGSSISILGALILGEAAVSANIASPIMIIIIGITFVTGLVFSSGEVIDGLRLYRLFLLLFTIIFGLYGLVIGAFLIVINLCNVESFGKPYLFPIAPFDKNYFFKTLLKKDKDTKRNKILSDNIIRGNL